MLYVCDAIISSYTLNVRLAFFLLHYLFPAFDCFATQRMASVWIWCFRTGYKLSCLQIIFYSIVLFLCQSSNGLDCVGWTHTTLFALKPRCVRCNQKWNAHTHMQLIRFDIKCFCCTDYIQSGFGWIAVAKNTHQQSCIKLRERDKKNCRSVSFLYTTDIPKIWPAVVLFWFVRVHVRFIKGKFSIKRHVLLISNIAANFRSQIIPYQLHSV